MMSPGDIFLLLLSLVVTDDSGKVAVSGAEVGSSAYFSLGCTGSQVGSKDRGFLDEYPWPSSSLSESSRCVRVCITLSLLSEYLYYVSVTRVPGVWLVHIYLFCGCGTGMYSIWVLENSVDML